METVSRKHASVAVDHGREWRSERSWEGALRIPWTSKIAARRSAFEQASPCLALARQLADSLLTAASLLTFSWVLQGEIGALISLAAVLAMLLASHLLDGTSLFVGGRRALAEGLIYYSLGWTTLVAVMLLLGSVSGYGHLIDARVVTIWSVATPVLLLAVHAALHALLAKGAAGASTVGTAVIVCATRTGRALAAAIEGQPLLRQSVVGFFDDRDGSAMQLGDHRLVGPISALPQFVRERGVGRIYITLPMTSQPRIVELIESLKDTTASIFFVPDMFVFDLIQTRFDEIGGIPVIAVCDSPFQGLSGLAKRSIDILLASAILAAIWPVMLLIAVAIKLESPGPAIFRQRRYGLDGKQIVVYKFRSMTVVEDGAEVVQAIRSDTRTTRLGAFLRRKSLDELPQFINVLQGRMSVVGPRPHAVSHNERYRKLVRGYMVRHKVRPGITGWAQVNGARGETDTLDKMERRIAYDLDYIRNWSIWLDFKIVAMTIVRGGHDPQAY